MIRPICPNCNKSECHCGYMFMHPRNEKHANSVQKILEKVSEILNAPKPDWYKLCVMPDEEMKITEITMETDLGRDLDDFLTICYLVSAGVKIRAMYVTPGDPDQLAIAHFLNDYLEMDCVICASKKNRDKQSSGGVHYQLLNKYGYPKEADAQPYDEANKFLRDRKIPHFIIGPPTVSGWIAEMGIPCIPGAQYSKDLVVMQGGFCSYDVHNIPVMKLDKFKGKDTVPSFNPGGAVKNALAIMNSDIIKEKRFIGKNVCHSVLYDKDIHSYMMSIPAKGKAGALLREAMELYLVEHEGKMLHDPTAAVLMLHPVLGCWIKGKPYREKGEWGTRLDENGDFVAVDVTRDMLMRFLAHGT